MVARSLLPVLVFLAGLMAAPMVSAQAFEATRRWLGSLGDVRAALVERVRLPLAPLSSDPERAWLESLGFALFRSSDLFGETARRAGLSCEVCHPGGGANRQFFVEGVSARPGTFDGTSALFEGTAEDGRFNPLAIPALGGTARTAPFGHRGDFRDLTSFTRHVIVEEFGGTEPDGQTLDALVAHMERLNPPGNQWLDDADRLSNRASVAARAGEAIFQRPFPNHPALSCAACHVPAANFADGRRHDIGTGDLIDTPSLRRGDLRAPFMHDGRFDRIDDVVGHFNSRFGLGLDLSDQANLVAYLEAVGGAVTEPVTLAGDLEIVGDLTSAAVGAVERRAPSAAARAIGVIRRELGQIHERFLGDSLGFLEAREALIRASASLRDAERHAEAGSWTLADELLRRTQDDLRAARPILETAAPRSLYDPRLLARALAARHR